MEERQDLISRQAAIDAVENINCSDGVGISALKCEAVDDVVTAIKALPSAQPYTDEEIQKMQDLEQAQFDTMYELGKQAAKEDLQPTCNQLATDYISRQVVLDWLNDEWDGMVLSVFDGIRALPSAQPEPQWIPCSKPPEEDGVYIVYAPDYSGGSSSAKECHDGVMFSKYKKGKWSIEHGYYNRPNCVKAWMPIEPWRGEQHEL